MRRDNCVGLLQAMLPAIAYDTFAFEHVQQALTALETMPEAATNKDAKGILDQALREVGIALRCIEPRAD